MHRSFIPLIFKSAIPLAIGIWPLKAWSRTWYVDDAGLNEEECGDNEDPCLTINYVENNGLAAGDTVHIKAGDYGGTANRITCPADNLTYEGERSALGATVLDGSGVWLGSEQAWVKIHNHSNVTVRNMIIVDVNSYLLDGGRAISATCDTGTCSGLTVEDVSFDEIWGPAIYVHADPGEGCDNAWWSDVMIDSNVVYDACLGEIILAYPPYTVYEVKNECITIERVDGFEVTANYVYGCGKESIDVKNGSTSGDVHDNRIWGQGEDDREVGIYVDGFVCGVSDIEVYDSEVEDIGHGVGIDIANEQCGVVESISVYNNILHENLVGLLVDSGDGCSGWSERIDGLTIVYNTIADSGSICTSDCWPTGLELRASTLEYADIANNIVVGTVGTGRYDIYAGQCSDSDEIVLENNLYGDYNENPGGDYSCNPDNDNTYEGADPDLDGSYHLGSSSDAIDEADTTWPMTYDFDHDTRDAQPDIGADEY